MKVKKGSLSNHHKIDYIYLSDNKLQVFTITKRLQRSVVIPRKLSRWQKLQLFFSGRAFLGWAKPEGFLGPVQFFLLSARNMVFT